MEKNVFTPCQVDFMSFSAQKPKGGPLEEEKKFFQKSSQIFKRQGLTNPRNIIEIKTYVSLNIRFIINLKISDFLEQF